MKQALGLVEIEGLSTAITVADAMVKAANVNITEVENTKGLGYMTIKVVGDVGAVNAAVNVGCQIGTMNGKLVSSKVIARPSDFVDKLFVDPKGRGEKPEPEVKDESEKKAEPEVKDESEKKAEPEVQAEPENKAEPEKKAEPEVKSQSEKKAEPEIKADPKKEAPDLKDLKNQPKKTKASSEAVKTEKKDS